MTGWNINALVARAGAVLVALLSSTCFAPTYPSGLACSPDNWCPAGQICHPEAKVCLDEDRSKNAFCGDQRIGANEDCDGLSAFGQDTACGEPGQPQACFYVCSPTGAAPVCPPGWGCGLDGQCRRPTGALQEPSSIDLPVESFAVGDVDGDALPDLIGHRGPEVLVRFGDENGTFEEELDLPVPTPVGPPAFGRFDGDKLFDVIIPFQGGLFTLLGRESRELEAVPYSSFEIPDSQDGVRIFAMEAYAQDQNSELLVMGSAGIRFFDSQSRSFVSFPGTGHSLDELAEGIALGNLLRSDGLDEFVLSFAGDTEVHVCVPRMASSERDLQPVCLDPLQVLQPRRVHPLGTQSTDVNGDGFLDILVATSDQDGAGLTVDVILHSPDQPDGFLPAMAAQELSARSATPWPLASGDFDLDDIADYVFSDGIVVTTSLDDLGLPATFDEAVPAGAAKWKSAVVADFNGDGRPDVAVTTEGTDDIDFYLNAGISGGAPVFNDFHVDTAELPVMLRTGDFDGDLVADLAFVENGPGVKPSTVSVCFGNTAGGPSQPVSMGSFASIEVLEPLFSPFENLTGRDSITDLAAISLPDGSTTRITTLLQGNSSRHMRSPLFLASLESVDSPLGVLLGNFFPDEQDSTSPIRDLAAIAIQVIDAIPGAARVWLLRGTDGSGALEIPQQPSLDLPDDRSTFDYLCTLWLAGNLDGDPLDEVIGIDGHRRQDIGCESAEPGRLLVTNLAGLDSGGAPTELALIPLDPSLSGVKTLLLHDMDSDGDQDLLTLFLGQPDDGAASVVVFWNTDGKLAGDDRTTLDLQGDEALLDIAAAQLTGDMVPELFILTGDRVLEARLDTATRSYDTASSLLDLDRAAGHLFVADANGDGLHDIIALDGAGVQITLQSPAEPIGNYTSGSAAAAVIQQ